MNSSAWLSQPYLRRTCLFVFAILLHTTSTLEAVPPQDSPAPQLNELKRAKTQAAKTQAAKTQAAKTQAAKNGRPGTVGREGESDLQGQSLSAEAEGVLRLHLMDGSMIAGRLKTQSLEVETSFGRLVVPVGRLKSFTPGLGSHPKLTRDLAVWIDDLGSPEFGRREAAQQELRRLGMMAREMLKRRANDDDAERRKRISALLEELDELSPEEEDPFEDSAGLPLPQGPLIKRDTIETTEFTIVGTIVQQVFEVESRYGALKVKLADIRRAERPSSDRGEIRKSLSVDGANLVQKQYKDSGIRLEKGDRVLVIADGNLVMSPWGNQAVVLPDGGPNYGWYRPGLIPVGCLMARVGNSGEEIKIGSRASFKASRAGTLQFAIAMQANFANNNFPGKYNIRVRVVRGP